MNLYRCITNPFLILILISPLDISSTTEVSFVSPPGQYPPPPRITSTLAFILMDPFCVLLNFKKKKHHKVEPYRYKMYAFVSVFFYSTLFLRLNHVVAWINGSFFYIVMQVFYSVKGPFKLFLVWGYSD